MGAEAVLYRDARPEIIGDEEFFPILQTSEQACEDYLFRLKWPHGFVCPTCGYGQAYTINTRRQPLYECVCCKHQTSLTAGTIMEGTRTPLIKWFTAIHYISDSDKGINAVSLRRLIHVTYKTAWNMLHAIRGALAQRKQTLPLSGKMCLHSETLSFCYPTASLLDPPENPSVIVCVSLTEEDKPCRVHMQTLQEEDYEGGQLSKEIIEEFCDHYMADTEQPNLCKVKRVVSSKFKKGLSFVRQAGEWLQSTFFGIGSKYRQRYLDEFCCRMNFMLAGLSPFQEISLLCACPVHSIS